jgi:hypothetical protein
MPDDDVPDTITTECGSCGHPIVIGIGDIITDLCGPCAAKIRERKPD